MTAKAAGLESAAVEAADGTATTTGESWGPSDANLPRQRIIEATIDGLTALDPAALSIQRICDRAQVTPPTLYHHFGSKDGIIAAAVDVLVTRWIDQLDAAVDRGGSLDQSLDQAVAAWHAMIAAPERPFAVFVWVSMWSDESRVALLRAREHAQKLIAEAIVDHVGDVPGSDDLAAMLLDGVLGAAVDFQLDADPDALRRRLTTLATMIRLTAAEPPKENP